MRRTFIITFFLLLTATGIFAQGIQSKLSYQAVVRNAANELVVNANLTVDISIANSQGDAAVYSETHNVTSNQNGLVSLLIGDGTNVSGNFSNVSWATAFITTDFTLPGDAHVVNTVPVTPVPYALYAENVNASALADYPTRAEMEAMIAAAIGTIFICGTHTVKDVEGNEYNTVKIGEQCWMKENLRTTKYANGTSIALGTSTSSTTAYRYYPDDDNSKVSTYGYLYNWKAVMGSSSSSNANPSGVQGICPTGWHVPSDAELTQLTNYVSSQSDYVCGSSNDNIANALAANTTDWENSTTNCAVGNNTTTNNATGFSALPAGGCYYGYYLNFGNYAFFWSATEGSDDNAYYRGLYYNYASVYRIYYNKYYGFSVRCVRD